MNQTIFSVLLKASVLVLLLDDLLVDLENRTSTELAVTDEIRENEIRNPDTTLRNLRAISVKEDVIERPVGYAEEADLTSTWRTHVEVIAEVSGKAGETAEWCWEFKRPKDSAYRLIGLKRKSHTIATRGFKIEEKLDITRDGKNTIYRFSIWDKGKDRLLWRSFWKYHPRVKYDKPQKGKKPPSKGKPPKPKPPRGG